jgi:hypothetical protein
MDLNARWPCHRAFSWAHGVFERSMPSDLIRGGARFASRKRVKTKRLYERRSGEVGRDVTTPSRVMRLQLLPEQ